MSTKKIKPNNKPGIARLNIFHYDPAYDGSGLEPSGFSYVFPFRKDNIGIVMELCQVFEELVCGDTYDNLSATITETSTLKESKQECSSITKYSPYNIKVTLTKNPLPAEKIRELTRLLSAWKSNIISSLSYSSDIAVMEELRIRLDNYFVLFL